MNFVQDTDLDAKFDRVRLGGSGQTRQTCQTCQTHSRLIGVHHEAEFADIEALHEVLDHDIATFHPREGGLAMAISRATSSCVNRNSCGTYSQLTTRNFSRK